jgi:hypothetical protein
MSSQSSFTLGAAFLTAGKDFLCVLVGGLLNRSLVVVPGRGRHGNPPDPSALQKTGSFSV